MNNQVLVIMMVGQLRAEGWVICHQNELLNSNLEFQVEEALEINYFRFLM